MTHTETTFSSNIPFFSVKDGKKSRNDHIRKIITHTPEVMVKITGFTHDFSHLKTHFAYIIRNGSLELEDALGGVYNASESIQYLYDYWKAHHWDSSRHQGKTRYTANLVLSMPYGTDATALKDAVRAFAKKTFADYRYVMALHQDTDNPHVHLTVQNCGMHGKRLQIKRGDPQKWREAFALELDKRGINAEATPRAIRGIVLKSVSQTLKHMKGRGVKLHTAKEAIDDIRFLWTQNKQTIQPRPWETAIQIKQKAIRNNWLALAETFKATDKYLSDQIIDFVKKMPDPCTKRESINQKIFESIRDKTRACQLLQDHPELKADIDKIHAAEHYANAKYIDNQQKEQFMQRVITDIAHKRINGKGLQSIQFDTDKPPKQKRNNLDKDFER